jgi:hypothetical protein
MGYGYTNGWPDLFALALWMYSLDVLVGYERLALWTRCHHWCWRDTTESDTGMLSSTWQNRLDCISGIGVDVSRTALLISR